MMTRSQTRIAQLEARISELEKENDKFKKEKSVLMAVAAGNYKRGEEFKAICREYFTAEYIDACARGMDSALVSEYFRDTEEEDNLLVQSMLEHNDEDLEDRLWEHYQDTKGHRNSIDGDLNYLREHCKDANQIKRLFDEDNRQEGYAYDIDKDEYYKYDEDSDEEDTDEEVCKNCDETYMGRKEPYCIMGDGNCGKGLRHISVLYERDAFGEMLMPPQVRKENENKE